MKTRPVSGPLLAFLLAAAPLLAAGDVSVGRFAPGETLAPFAVDSPEADSRTFVKTVTPDGGRAVVEIPATGTGTLLVWVLPSGPDGAALRAGGAAERELETSLTTPAGRVLGPGADGGRESVACPLRAIGARRRLSGASRRACRCASAGRSAVDR